MKTDANDAVMCRCKGRQEVNSQTLLAALADSDMYCLQRELEAAYIKSKYKHQRVDNLLSYLHS